MKRCKNCFEEYDEANHLCPKCGYVDGEDPRELYYLYPGTILANRYQIGRGIGSGGFGITYLAWDLKLEITVCVKEYYPGGIVNRIPGRPEVLLLAGKQKKQFEVYYSRFLEEARSMAQFSAHENIVNVFEYFEENHTAYIVMEYLDGIDLTEYVDSHGGKLTVEDTLRITGKLCNALHTIHKKGIIHRDIAPDNIKLQEDGSVKLFDFGAAKLSNADSKDMMIIVKPGFSPVEQYNRSNGDAQGTWTDIYALGAVMYYMLTGEKPDESTNRKVEQETNASVFSDTMLPPNQLNSEVSENLSNTIMKALEVYASFRFQTIEELQKALFGGKKVLSPQMEHQKKKNKRNLTLGISSFVVCIALAVFGVNALRKYVPSSELLLWYELSGNSMTDAQKKNGIEETISEFQNFFPQVQITAEGIDADKYRDRIQEAEKNDCLPDIFESTQLTDEMLDNCIQMSRISTDDLCEYGSLSLAKWSGIRLPVGFRVPVLYLNDTLDSLGDMDAVVSSIDPENLTITIQKEERTLDYDGIFSSSSDLVSSIETDELPLIEQTGFLSRELSACIGSTHDYYEFVTSMPGQVRAIPCSLEESDVFQPAFDLYWSAASHGYRKNQGERAFLNFLLTERAQETLLVKNHGDAMPLNLAALSSYCSVYQDIYSEIMTEIGG